VKWHQDGPIPAAAGNLIVKSLDNTGLRSFFPRSIFGRWSSEEEFARAGYPVVSNCKNHRMAPDVHYLIPEVNAAHLDAIPVQQKNRGYGSGFMSPIRIALDRGPVLVENPAR